MGLQRGSRASVELLARQPPFGVSVRQQPDHVFSLLVADPGHLEVGSPHRRPARGKLRRILDRAEAEHRERLARYRALATELAELGVDPFARATLSFGLHYEEAVLRWFGSLPDEVRRR
jgi:hypothetical protein